MALLLALSLASAAHSHAPTGREAGVHAATAQGGHASGAVDCTLCAAASRLACGLAAASPFAGPAVLLREAPGARPALAPALIPRDPRAARAPPRSA